jgi:hypothetical protein
LRKEKAITEKLLRQLAALEERTRAIAAAPKTSQPVGSATPPRLPPGVNVLNASYRKQPKESEKYVYYAWKVTLFNNSTDPTKVAVHWSGRDREDFEVESKRQYDVRLAPGETKIVAREEMAEPKVWLRIVKSVGAVEEDK